jgi:hypothetical protein
MPTTRAHVRGRRQLYRYPLIWLVGIALVVATALLVLHLFQESDSTNGIDGSGVAATETRHVAAFDAVELVGVNDVDIHVGRKQSVTVHSDRNLLRHVTTEVQGSRLVIDTPGSFSTLAPMRVDIGVPALSAVSLSGSGRLRVDGIDAKLLTVTADGTGAVYAQGHARRVDATLNGSGDLELQRLVAREAHALVPGSGQIWVYATRSVSASVPGTGAVFYSGDPPRVMRKVSGTGAVVAK